jgi:hypothetical protein
VPLVDDSVDESTPWLISKMQARFLTTQHGFILDSECSNTPEWCVTCSGFERWFSEIESILNHTLGRRLAHASAESEEWRWSFLPPLPSKWIGQQKKRITIVNADWATRGMGQLAMLESSGNTATILVANRNHTALAAGMANAVWECIEEQRFRFQWSDRGARETVIEVTSDPREIPKPSGSNFQWVDDVGAINKEMVAYDRARHETDGFWTVEGNRMMMLSRDLLLRFESLSTPYIEPDSRSTDSRTEWSGIVEAEQNIFWDAMAEASRRQFLASGELVLIASPEHWIDVGRRYLSMRGLGHIGSAVETDEHGGVELAVPAALHPAIVVGVLIGCWERAEGRAAKATWVADGSGHKIRIESRRRIAD